MSNCYRKGNTQTRPVVEFPGLGFRCYSGVGFKGLGLGFKGSGFSVVLGDPPSVLMSSLSVWDSMQFGERETFEAHSGIGSADQTAYNMQLSLPETCNPE